jgi:hypothetical protein
MPAPVAAAPATVLNPAGAGRVRVDPQVDELEQLREEIRLLREEVRELRERQQVPAAAGGQPAAAKLPVLPPPPAR